MVSAMASTQFSAELERVGEEYVEWVEGAKRPETRTRRVAATLEALREGKYR
jgi:uncharacterized protein YdeI (YjbR/CyaY-like superfamily)